MPILTITTPSHHLLVILGAVCWIVGLEFFLAEAIAAAGWPGYSYADLDISLLGAVTCGPSTDPSVVGQAVSDQGAAGVFQLCSPRHAVMNFGFVLLGVLHLSGIALTWSAWPRSWLTTVGLASLTMGAAGAVFVGLAPVDQDHGLHVAGAGLGLVVGNMGVAAMGVSLLRRAPAFGLFSLALGAGALAGFALYVADVYLGLGHGGMERLAAYPQTVWYAATGLMVLAGALKARAPLPSSPRASAGKP